MPFDVMDRLTSNAYESYFFHTPVRPEKDETQNKGWHGNSRFWQQRLHVHIGNTTTHRQTTDRITTR